MIFKVQCFLEENRYVMSLMDGNSVSLGCDHMHYTRQEAEQCPDWLRKKAQLEAPNLICELTALRDMCAKSANAVQAVVGDKQAYHWFVTELDKIICTEKN